MTHETHSNNDNTSQEKRVVLGDVAGKLAALKEIEGIDPRIFHLAEDWTIKYGQLLAEVWALSVGSLSGLELLEQDFFATRKGKTVILPDTSVDTSRDGEAYLSVYRGLENMRLITIEGRTIIMTELAKSVLKLRALNRLIESLYARHFEVPFVIQPSLDQEELLRGDLS